MNVIFWNLWLKHKTQTVRFFLKAKLKLTMRSISKAWYLMVFEMYSKQYQALMYHTQFWICSWAVMFFLFFFLIYFWDSKLQSKLLKLFLRSRPAIVPNFSRWIITNLQIWARNMSHLIVFYVWRGPQAQDPNRLISLKSWTRPWDQFSRFDILWLLRNLLTIDIKKVYLT